MEAELQLCDGWLGSVLAIVTVILCLFFFFAVSRGLQVQVGIEIHCRHAIISTAENITLVTNDMSSKFTYSLDQNPLITDSMLGRREYTQKWRKIR